MMKCDIFLMKFMVSFMALQICLFMVHSLFVMNMINQLYLIYTIGTDHLKNLQIFHMIFSVKEGHEKNDCFNLWIEIFEMMRHVLTGYFKLFFLFHGLVYDYYKRIFDLLIIINHGYSVVLWVKFCIVCLLIDYLACYEILLKIRWNLTEIIKR